MLRFARTSAFALGVLTAAAAHAQSSGYPSAAYPAAPAYGYSYPAYNPGGYYDAGVPPSASYMGRPYAAPKAFWDPYVGWRPYSDNAGPKASGHGD